MHWKPTAITHADLVSDRLRLIIDLVYTSSFKLFVAPPPYAFAHLLGAILE